MHLLDMLIEQLNTLDIEITNKMEQIQSRWEKRRSTLSFLKRTNSPIFDESINEVKFLLKKKSQKNILIESIERTILTKRYDDKLFDSLAEFEIRSPESSSETLPAKKQPDPNDFFSIRNSCIKTLDNLIKLIKQGSVEDALSARLIEKECRPHTAFIPIATQPPRESGGYTDGPQAPYLNDSSHFFKKRPSSEGSPESMSLELENNSDNADADTNTDSDAEELAFHMDL